MSCKPIKTPHAPNMTNISTKFLTPTKSGEIDISPQRNVIKFDSGDNISSSNVNIPVYSGGTQDNSDDVAIQTITPAFLVGLSVNTVHATSARITTRFDTILTDTDGSFNTSLYRYVPKQSGVYMFTAQLHQLSGTGVGWDAAFYKNGSKVFHGNFDGTEANNMSILLEMDGAGDYVEVNARIFGGLPNGIRANDERTKFMGFKIGDLP